MEAAGLPLPEFRQDGFMFRSTIRKMADTRKKNDGTSNGTLNGTLNEKQQEVLKFITNNPGVKALVITARLGIPRDTLNKIIKHLVDNQLIERIGSKKTGGYHTIDDNIRQS